MLLVVTLKWRLMVVSEDFRFFRLARSYFALERGNKSSSY